MKNFFNTNWKDYIFWNWWWCGPLLWANTFSPFGMNRQKTDTCEWNISPFVTFSPYGKQYMSEDYTKLESIVEWRRRMNNLMEWSGSLVFAEELHFPFNLWLIMKWTWKNSLVIAHERDMIKGIFMSYVCKTSKEIPRIKNI